MTDVLIAGGGIAGSALAIQLGRMGFSVELFERSRFPREKPCGEGLMPAGVAALNRLRLSSVVEGVPFNGIRYHISGKVVQGRFRVEPGIPSEGRGIRRRDLERALFESAGRIPGVSARQGARVQSVHQENGRVVGLIVGDELRRGKLIVGADGAHSRIRHSLGLHETTRQKRIGMRAHFRLAPGQCPSEWVDVYLGRGFELYVTPLCCGELLVAALTRGDSLQGNVAEQFADFCGSIPELGKRLHGAQQVSELRVIAPLSGRARTRYVPGLILLGDAAGYSDPLTGGGMTQALLAAELLAQYAGEGLETADEWIAEYDRICRKMLRDYILLTEAMLWLADHPRLIRGIMEVLHRCSGLFSHLLGVAGGTRRLKGGELRTCIERKCT